jgi:nitroreductase/NAD-dependent dihydropyrimidine dehydrogenase PreA subunit
MTLLNVDQSKCRKDGLCVSVCPGAIIRLNKKTGFPDLIPRAEKACIRCGHCVAVCPHGAMDHLDVPMAQCTPIKKELAITPDQAVQFLRSRRSIRVFKDRPVPEEELKALIEIARYAPTAGNAQSIKWLVLTDKALIRRFAELTVAHMRHTINTADPSTYAPYWPALVAAWDKGADVVLRSAPALVIAAAPRGSAHHGMTDVTLALSYLELAAQNRGLGTCWAGLLHVAMCDAEAFSRDLPVLRTHSHLYPLMVGYPAVRYHRLPKRKAPNIQWLSAIDFPAQGQKPVPD